MSDDRAPKPPSAYQLQGGDVAGFGWDFGDGPSSVILYFQPPSLHGALLQVAMSLEQFRHLAACAREMESSMGASAIAIDAEPQVPAPTMAGEES